MAKPVNDPAESSGKVAAEGYGKLDPGRTRDVMAEVGQSKGKQNNPGDFGNDSRRADEVNQKADERRRDALATSSGADDPPSERERISKQERQPAEPPGKYPS